MMYLMDLHPPASLDEADEAEEAEEAEGGAGVRSCSNSSAPCESVFNTFSISKFWVYNSIQLLHILCYL